MKKLNFADVTITWKDSAITVKDGGVTRIEFGSAFAEDSNYNAITTIVAIWHLYYYHDNTRDKRVSVFENGTGLKPVKIRKPFVKCAIAPYSGAWGLEPEPGKVLLTVAPTCSNGYKNPVIENRTYDVTKLYKELKKFFSSK
ncbi:MAG: hypothetical protein D6706_20035 [Chloroflexi bacterium]|nr:MAG: hypothetical protein D6706_20035 [Chloroflexota bacterium]